jgi:hypothetical protein
MGVGLANQDESEPLGRSSAAKRLVAGAVVAEDNRLQPAACPAMRGQPALGGSELPPCCCALSCGRMNAGASGMPLSPPGLTSTGVRAAW